MKYEFDSSGKNYLEIYQNPYKDEIQISISSSDSDNPRKRTINIATISKKDWIEIVLDTFSEEEIKLLKRNE